MEWVEREPLLSRLNKPTLQGLGAPSSGLLKCPHRPALSAVVCPSDAQEAHSAYPVLAASGLQGEDNSPKGSPPVHWAFSALIPSTGILESYSDESSFDGPDMSLPAQAYAKRQQIKTIHIIDCRFDYEYAGGHIPGAVNVNTTAGVEELLLGPNSIKAKPSFSGDSVKKIILVFHCGFSAKRAPTL